MTREERITYYEAILDRLTAAADELARAMEAFRAVQPQAAELAAYYGSPAWRRDLAADEAGKLPQTLKRGVLSEDAAWNVLAEYDRLQALLSAAECDSGEE